MLKETWATYHKQETASFTKELKTNKHIKATMMTNTAVRELIGQSLENNLIF